VIADKLRNFFEFDHEATEAHARDCGYTSANCYVTPHYNGSRFEHARTRDVVSAMIAVCGETQALVQYYAIDESDSERSRAIVKALANLQAKLEERG